MEKVLTPDNYAHQLAVETHRLFAFCATTKADFEAWQRAFRPYLRTMLGMDAIAARGICDLRPHQVGEETLADHVREEWTIQTEPGFEVPFYLLRPLGVTAPLPLVLTPHGHGKAGKRTYAGLWDTEAERLSIADGERDVALQAVREGYIAIAPDMRAFASLRLQKDIEANTTSSCRDLQMRALLFGRTLIGERVWDIGRLIDYAATRPEVDANRIVMTGNSGGGTISLFAAACDPRIAIAVPSSYFCTFESSIGSIHHCECNYIPGMLATAEMYDVAGLIAPRPFLAVAGREDLIFPYAGVTEAFERLLHIYDVAGAPEHCQLYTGDGGHRYYKAGVWPFIRHMLASKGEASPERFSADKIRREDASPLP
jgi:dienelactone hydrolase